MNVKFIFMRMIVIYTSGSNISQIQAILQSDFDMIHRKMVFIQEVKQYVIWYKTETLTFW